MTDEQKTKEELIRELAELRRQLAELQAGEVERVQIERQRALGQMSAGLSHNLNNILTGIMGPAQLLQRATEDPDLLIEVEEIISSARRVREIVRRLRRSVKGADETAPGAVSLRSIVATLAGETQRKWQDEGLSIKIVTRLDGLLDIAGTEEGLQDVFQNLLSNAVEAMPDGGTIRIDAQSRGEEVVLAFSDTGSGMPEDVRKRVFEPFFTTKTNVGSGLGLSGVHGIITQWDGRIEVESTPGRGTTFRIHFPVHTGLQPEEQKSVAREVDRGSILIIEDDASVQRVLSRLLSKNYEVETALDASEAFKRFAPGRYGVALIDLGLPGEPGEVVAERIRQMDPSAITVLMTGWELEPNDPRLAAFDLRLQKPFDSLDKVEEVVAEAMTLHISRVRGQET